MQVVVPACQKTPTVETGARALIVLQTERLLLSQLSERDADFILELLNDPSFLRFIGDRQVRTVEQARDYILSGPRAMYERHGIGLYLVTTKTGATRIGICGLLKRDALPDVDVGFAFLPAFRGQGFAREAAAGVMAYGRQTLGLDRIVAIVNPENAVSKRLLHDLGFAAEGSVRLSNDAPELELLACTRIHTRGAMDMERTGEAYEGDAQLTVIGAQLHPGDRAPDFALDALAPGDAVPREVKLSDGTGRVRLLHVVNSLDTPVCHVGAHRFDDLRAAKLPNNVDVYTVSMDLPFAQQRWRGLEGVQHEALSSHRSEEFGRSYGVLLREWRLLQRAVFVIDGANRVTHAEYVADQMAEPDYAAAVAAALSAARPS